MGNARWVTFRTAYYETDLWIAYSPAVSAQGIEKFTLEKVVGLRELLDNHIRKRPEFLSSLVPLKLPDVRHPMIRRMYEASQAAGTGPMSAVAGAIAEYLSGLLMEKYDLDELVIENGGDIFMTLLQPATISVYAGNSPLSDKIGLSVKPEQTPVSICCSSATVGHSLSFGAADACLIACKSGAMADAYATACCNSVKSTGMIGDVTGKYIKEPGVLSVVIVKDDRVGAGGEIELTVL